MARCGGCGSWTMALACPTCGTCRLPSTPVDQPVDDPAETRAHWGVLEAERRAYDTRRRPSGARTPTPPG